MLYFDQIQYSPLSNKYREHYLVVNIYRIMLLKPPARLQGYGGLFSGPHTPAQAAQLTRNASIGILARS